MKGIIKIATIVLVLALITACSGPVKQEPGISSEPNYTVDDSEELNKTNNGDNIYSKQAKTNISLYFYDPTSNSLTAEVRSIVRPDTDEALYDYIIKSLIRGPQNGGLEAVISSDTELIKTERAENILTINLSGAFLESDDILIARVALTNTLTELDGIKYIKIYVDGEELTDTGDREGVVLGLLTKYPADIAEIQALERKHHEEEVKSMDRALYFRDYHGSYLLPEVRTINITNNRYVEAIVEELLRGPAKLGEGAYPTLPEGTVVEKTEKITNEDSKGVALYLSEEFKKNFTGNANNERTMLASMVYSLVTPPDISFIKIYYDDGTGNYTDIPVHTISLRNELYMDQFPDYVGRRVRVYFADSSSGLLEAEYRAVSSDTGNSIAERIFTVLTSDPIKAESERVIPLGIKASDFDIKIVGTSALIKLPDKYIRLANEETITRNLYAIVNSITDPANYTNIKQVQFILEGQGDNSLKGISLKDPLVMNAALIKENKE